MRADARAAAALHFETFLGDPDNASIRPSLVHGDFGTANILHDPRARRVTGVIDFGEARLDDPAVDLAAVLWGPAELVAAIETAYGRTNELRQRIRFYAGTFALQEALFGLDQRDAGALRRGLAPYI
jgi:aminoglycoside 2''-phosphotransferase